MGSLAQNMAKGTLLAGRGVKAGVGWVVLTVAVLMMTSMAGVVMGPFALAIPVLYVLFAGEYALNKTRNALSQVAEGAA